MLLLGFDVNLSWFSGGEDSHVRRGRVSGAAVSVGVQVVQGAVELLVAGLQQAGGAPAQRAWGAAAK